MITNFLAPKVIANSKWQIYVQYIRIRYDVMAANTWYFYLISSLVN